MAETRSFKALVQRNVATDRVFAEALLYEGKVAARTDDIETAKIILGRYLNIEDSVTDEDEGE